MNRRKIYVSLFVLVIFWLLFLTVSCEENPTVFNVEVKAPNNCNIALQKSGSEVTEMCAEASFIVTDLEGIQHSFAVVNPLDNYGLRLESGSATLTSKDGGTFSLTANESIVLLYMPFSTVFLRAPSNTSIILSKDNKVITTIEDGLRALEMVKGAYISAKEKRTYEFGQEG
ncbi:MAG: hypothetical protein HQ557_18915 [Bacteroidetes bacterium]|nr:hypothetical protein [Bacteroidota bacterium]